MTENSNPTLPSTPTAEPAPAPARKKGGRPKGSKNKKAPAPKKPAKKVTKKVRKKATGKSTTPRAISTLTQLRNRAFLNEVTPALLSVFQVGHYTNFADFYTTFASKFPQYKMGETIFKSLCRSAGIRMAHMLVGPKNAIYPPAPLRQENPAPAPKVEADEDDEELGGVDGTHHLVEV